MHSIEMRTEAMPSYRIKSLAAMALGMLMIGLAGIGAARAEGPGPEVCKNCHEAEVNAYANSVHGAKGNLKGPAAAGECSTCHGDATEHVKAGGGRGVGGIKNPGSKAMAATESSDTCMACHKRDSKRSHWEGSTHQTRDVPCAACHTMHGTQDKVLAKLTQPEV
ncbi:MAG TPA: hypothetical protein VFI62_06570, partial [Burkholderiales bacterium]|nr:hypothetical protein [Burkholderiales bacterium]